MPLFQCPDCQTLISDQAVSCPRCGRPTQATNTVRPPVQSPNVTSPVANPISSTRPGQGNDVCPFCQVSQLVFTEKLQECDKEAIRKAELSPTFYSMMVVGIVTSLVGVGFVILAVGLYMSQNSKRQKTAELLAQPYCPICRRRIPKNNF